MKKKLIDHEYYCDVCGIYFKGPQIHISGHDFCDWPCCYSKLGQQLLEPFIAKLDKMLRLTKSNDA